MKKLLIISSAILIPLGVTAITLSVILVKKFKESEKNPIGIKSETIQDALDATVKGETYEDNAKAIEAIEKTQIDGIASIKATLKPETREAISKGINFSVVVTPKDGYKLEKKWYIYCYC